MDVNLYGVYWLKKEIHADKGRIITPDSQVVVFNIEPDGKVLVCRFGNYLDSIATQSENLTRVKSK